MWSKFYEILRLVAKYGQRAVNWCWANRSTIWYWLNRGSSVLWIVEQVRQAVGG